MSSDDEFLSGVVKGTISYTEEKIKELVRQFKDKKLAFIQDDDTISIVKDQLKSGEWELCKKYLKDNRLKILVQMGMTLRYLDRTNQTLKLQKLREKIVYSHGSQGLHIAQLVQNKILSEFIGSYVSQTNKTSDIINNVELLLNNVDRYVVFVKTDDTPDILTKNIMIKLVANVPEVFIIFARESAIPNGNSIYKNLQDTLPDYDLTIKQERKQMLVFLFKKSSD